MANHASIGSAELNVRPHSVLPSTIIDQIFLWQIERDRMQATSGYLFKDFESQRAFEGPCRYAEDVGVLVWKDEKKRMFFVHRHEDLVQYMRRTAKIDEA